MRFLCLFAFIVFFAAGLAWSQEKAAEAPAAPAAPPNYMEEGDKLMESQQYSKALSKYMMAWLDTPDNPAAIDRIGDIFFATNKYPEATRFYALAIKLNPGFEEPVVSLAYTYLKVNRPEQTIILLSEPSRQKLFAKSFRYQHALGQAYLAQGKGDKAIPALKAAVGLAPKVGYLYGDLANAYFITNRFPEAVTAYDKALEITPDDAVAALNRSMAQEKLSRFREAVASLELYLTLSKAPEDHPQRKRLAELKAKVK